MMFYDSGQQAKRFMLNRDRVLTMMAKIISEGQKRGTIRKGEKPEHIGWVAFCIYQVELRRWLVSDTPDLARGLKDLEKALKLFLTGANVSPK